MKQCIVSLLSCLLVVCLLAGCGGGGTSSNQLPQTLIPGTALTIGADTLMNTTRRTSRAVTLQAPLDAGAIISVYDFRTGVKLASSTLGANGFGTVAVTPGLTVAVIVTGVHGNKSYRLSTLIPSVPTTSQTILASADTTLAAEAIAARFYKQQTGIDTDTFSTVLTAAQQFLQSLPVTQQDVSLGGNLLTAGTTFGTNALNANNVTAVTNTVPATIDDKLVKAKNSFEQIKEVGLPLSSLSQDERGSMQTTYQASSSALANLAFDDVKQKYNALGSRLNTLLLPACNGNWQDTAGNWGTTLFQLQIGKGYRATSQASLYDPTYSWLTLTPDATLNTAGQITVVLNNTDGSTLKLIARDANGSWTITETSSGDAALQYQLIIPDTVVQTQPGANPTIQGHVSLKDQYITTPLTFDGTLRAIGAAMSSYTSISFTGKLSTPELTINAGASVTYPATVPAGAPNGSQVYDYPTSLSLTNASISVTKGAYTTTFTGSASAKLSVLTDNGEPHPMPTELHLNGNLTSSTTGNSVTIAAALDAVVTYKNVNGNQLLIPQSFDLKNATIKATSGSTVITLVGNISARGTAILINNLLTDVPTFFSISGSLDDSATGEHFDGLISAQWTNPTNNMDFTTVSGAINLKGTVKMGQAVPYQVDITLTVDGSHNATCAFNTITFGPNTFTGSLSGTLTANGVVTNATLKLTNQDHVTLTLNYQSSGITGSLSVAGVQEATIQSGDYHTVQVTYTDQTIVILPV